MGSKAERTGTGIASSSLLADDRLRGGVLLGKGVVHRKHTAVCGVGASTFSRRLTEVCLLLVGVDGAETSMSGRDVDL